MKIFLLILLQSLAVQTQARGMTKLKTAVNSVIDFKCVNRMPMTSFILKTQGDEAVLTTIHHNGTRFMPIHEGLVVPNDIKYLTDVANVLTLMGDRNEFRFPIAQCKIYGAGQMGCGRGSTENFHGREMQALYLHTSRVQESAFGNTSERTKVTLSVYVSNFVPVQDIVMNYDDGECFMNF